MRNGDRNHSFFGADAQCQQRRKYAANAEPSQRSDGAGQNRGNEQQRCRHLLETSGVNFAMSSISNCFSSSVTWSTAISKPSPPKVLRSICSNCSPIASYSCLLTTLCRAGKSTVSSRASCGRYIWLNDAMAL